MVAIVSFNDALDGLRGAARRHLLLGNGFSISLKPDIFSYGSLYDNARFDGAPNVPDLFEVLQTKDFELVIRHLLDAAKVIDLYRTDLSDLSEEFRHDAEIVKDALVTAIAERHPNRPYDISPDQYRSCRTFISNFDHIYTLNYDVLLYWSLMQNDIDALNLHSDDGFRHPENGEDTAYVSWQQADSASVSYLHGALHLFDRGTEITKYTWSRTDRAIVDQVREALNEDRYPIFVAEGTSASKQERIIHNAYLHKALRSFESSMKSRNNSLIIFGHSLADNDFHIFRYIAQGSIGILAVGLYGDQGSENNQIAIANAERLVRQRFELRGPQAPLELIFYDAESAHVWG